MAYLARVVAALPEDDPLRNTYARLSFVHPESALATYLAGAALNPLPGPAELIFPFSANLSQRDAMDVSLAHQVSVIEGPPGTGKTQTILNLIANIVRDPRATVGVVAFSNAAVDNVFDKLTQNGFGFFVAPLGSRAKRAEFLDGQAARNAALKHFMTQQDPRRYTAAQLAGFTASAHRAYRLERDLALLRAAIDRLEHERYLFNTRFPAPGDRLALPAAAARWGAARMLELLADVELLQYRTSRMASLVWAIKRRWRYRLGADVDEQDPAFAVEVQRRYFEARVREHGHRVQSCEAKLNSPMLSAARERMQELSLEILRGTLRQRYHGKPASVHTETSLWRERDRFAEDYPVLLSTCHSLPSNVGAGRLLDYLIIDEASQVNLAVAVLAMSVARRVIVVGDIRQLPHIAADVGGVGPGEHLAAYDYGDHNILSSLMAVYGEWLPRTMLREHYRCDPRIIDFCNRKFYRGQLIPMRAAGDDAPLALMRTAPGWHSRSHAGGGHTNERELEVLVREAIPNFLAGIPESEVGIVTPFRKQADLISHELRGFETDTVHKFQGREKRAIIMSAVIDASHGGTRVAEFVDDPHLINVAVSRAQSRFVLVCNPDLPPECQHLRDLVAYIEQRSPGHVLASEVVSVFDVLYTEYADVLRTLVSRLRGAAPYRSEEAALVMLQDLLNRDEFEHLRLNYQVFLHHLLPRDAALTPEEAAFVRHRASADFVISNRTTDQVLGVIEVDGFTYHQDNPEQLRRDALKDSILAKHNVAVLRLPTTGSGEPERVARFLHGLAS